MPRCAPGDSATFTAWRRGSDLPAGGSGERRTEVGARGAAVVRRELERRAPGDVLVVVTHGGTARATIGTLLGLPVEHWDVFGGLANCSWSVLEEVGARRVAPRGAQRGHLARGRRGRRRLTGQAVKAMSNAQGAAKVERRVARRDAQRDDWR